ncbi:hypothetical protein HDR60_05015 [bacterium]|nr:hypothetical protein [bacterium]
MQKRYYLFPILLIGVIGVSALESRRSGGLFFKDTSPDFSLSSNVATIDDIIAEAPNSAFLPSDSDIIEYQDVALNDDADNSSFDDLENDNVIEVQVSSVPEIKVEEAVKEVYVPKNEEKVASVKSNPKPVAVSKNLPTSRQLTKAKNNNPVSVDSFPNVMVNEGEEVLVSVSENKNPVYRNPVPVTRPVPIPVKQTVAPQPIINNDDYFEEEVANVDENPFGVSVSNISTKNSGNFKRALNSVEVSENSDKRKSDISFGQANNPFVKAFSAIKPEKKDDEVVASSKRSKSKKEKVVASVSPKNLKRDLYHTYISDNQYLSPAEYYDDEDEFYDDAEEYDEQYAEDEDFAYEKNVGDALEGDVGPVNVNKIKEKFQNAKKSSDLPSGPLKVGNREVLQMKLDFEPDSSAISGESVNIIRSFAQIATDQPTNSIQIAISEKVMNDPKAKKLAARRLAIVSNVLRNAGISDKQINPVLTNRDADSFSFRVVSNDTFDRLKVSKGTDIFGEEENVQEYNLMRW